MNIQEAYVKGLNDAEDGVITTLTQLVLNEPLTNTFANPKLEALKDALRVQLDYVNGLANNKKSNIAKFARKELQKGIELVQPSVDISE